MKSLITTLCLATVLFTQAQNSIDLLTISGRYGFPQAYDAPFQNEKATETGAMINLKIPIKLSEKSIWFSNFTYTNYSVNKNFAVASEDAVMKPIGLNAFILQTGLVQRIDENRAFQLLFVPRFMTDFVAPTGKSWQFGGIALYEQTFNQNLTMRFGAMYNQELAGPFVVPLIDINWKISSRWSITGLAPIYLKVNYKVSERFVCGFSHFGLVTSYYLTDPNYLGDYMERTSIDLGLFGRWKMLGNWHLEGRIGYALGRNYEQYAADEKIDFRISIIKIGDHRGPPKNVAFGDGPIASLRLVYSLPLP